MEKRVCQNCTNEFLIEPEDFSFYKKMNVPAPTWCPPCREMRRVLWTNPISLFRRACNAPGHTEQIITKYPDDSPHVVYDAQAWWSDSWDPMDYGKKYDFSRPFLEQFLELFRSTPVKNLDSVNSTNCDFCSSGVECKDSYMLAGGYRSESCLYGDTIIFCKDCVDSYAVNLSEHCYECLNCNKCYNLFYSTFCNECINSMFLESCTNCSECIACVNLKNAKYCIFNVQYTKEEYEAKRNAFQTESRNWVVDMQKRFSAFLLENPKKFAAITKSINCTGHIIENSKNCNECFAISGGAENCKFIFDGGVGLKDGYDSYAGGGNTELVYEIVSTGLDCSRVLFSCQIQRCIDTQYSCSCYSSSHLFGCVGLRKKEYCILNTQYTKEEYEALVPKIIEHMKAMPYVDTKGRVYSYGEFFPPEFSPFPYNRSNAQEYFPKSEAETLESGFIRKNDIDQRHTITMKSENIPDILPDRDHIEMEVIECVDKGDCRHQCTKVFRIIPQEFDFYTRFKIPLPRLCPNCRHSSRLAKRNFGTLVTRSCMCGGEKSDGEIYVNKAQHPHKGKCSAEFKTPFPAGSPDILYCEECYQAEIA